MSSPTREQIATALFTLVSSATYLTGGAPVFNVTSRRLKLWGDVPPTTRPAMFMVEHGETHLQKGQGLPTVRTLKVELFIYINAKIAGSIPDIAINSIVDAIDPITGGILKPNNVVRNTQTLGGLVEHVWIEGEIFKDPGDIDGDGMIIIPINILIP